MAKFLRSSASNTDDRKEQMQRIRVGLTGLAVVLIIVVLASMLMSKIGDQSQSENPANASKAKRDSDEPLAHLGVAPGAANTSEPAK